MRKAQVWYTDFIVGVLIFSIVIVTYFYYVERSEASDENLMGFIISEAKTISGYLVTEGFPTNWTGANVSTVGISDGAYRIDMDKLSTFNTWGYEERRGYLHTTKDYYFFIEYLNGTKFNELCKDPFQNCSDWNKSNHLAQTTRLLIYNQSIVKLVLNIYQQP